MPRTSSSRAAAPKAASTLTPMLRHYLEVKEEYVDAILLYRMGDFYELFFEDAVRAAPLLDVTLTARQKGTPSEAPMCGVPHHAVEGYIGKLIDAGLRVAVCDQVEDPAQAKGLVKREVTRVVTPGTLTEPELLEGADANLLASIRWGEDPANDPGGGVAFLDVSTGRFFVRRFEDIARLVEELELWRPTEVLYVDGQLDDSVSAWASRREICLTARGTDLLASPSEATQLLERQLGVSSLRGFGVADDSSVLLSAAEAVRYARESTRSELGHIRNLELHRDEQFLILDDATLENLEVFRTQRGDRRSGTLISVVDRTQTPAGARMLRDWLAHPLRSIEEIERRQDATADLLEAQEQREILRAALSRVGDLERLSARAVVGRMGPREAAALRDGLEQVPDILERLKKRNATFLLELGASDPQAELASYLAERLEETPSVTLRSGGVIADGVDPELDRNRSLARDGKRHLLELEAKEREATGIGNLKIRFNKVFGYYLEVTKAHQSRVPERYTRKQTLANAERYVTDELKELEEAILGAEQKQIALEESLFESLRQEVAKHAMGLGELAYALAAADVIASFAERARGGDYCRPRLVSGGDCISIREGRHPVVEESMRSDFVPNDLVLQDEDSQVVLLTGPNMGGKSTYLRQIALITLLAHTGSYVPAREAEIALTDRIFTRVGASDDLSRGESTFMVEMIETANILRYATAESLVILDEVGRGTSTFDGLSLAWAIVEHLHEENRSRTLFATHYHELTELQAVLSRVVNRTMTVKEWDDRIVFLHRVEEGRADKSYGIHVARLAGLPESLLSRASEILSNLEADGYDPTGKPRIARGEGAPVSTAPDQLGLFAGAQDVVMDLLSEVDLDRMTPLAALNFLARLKERSGT